MAKRKKRWPCGHYSFGQLCITCRDKEAADAKARTAKEERRGRLDASPVSLKGIPNHVQDKALKALDLLKGGAHWSDVGGKLIDRKGSKGNMPKVVSVPLGGKSYRLVLMATGGDALLPTAVLSHEAYNKYLKRIMG